MNLIEFVIIATIIVILLGCVFLTYSSSIYNYFTETTLASYDRYDISMIDNDDLDNIGKVMGTVVEMNRSSINDSSKPKPNNEMGIIDRNPNPNSPIPDDKLMSLTESNRNFGNELPWDKEVGFCELLKNTDKDLYRNVQDSTSITIY